MVSKNSQITIGTREQLVKVVREKAQVIKRYEELAGIVSTEIEVKSFCNNFFVCRIRGMTYSINLTSGKESMQTYTPVDFTTGNGCRVRSSGIASNRSD